MKRVLFLGIIIALSSCSPPQEEKKPAPAPSAGKEVNILHITSESHFKSRVLDSEGAFLVDFYADWCAPCRELAPIVSSLAKTYAEKATIAKVNVDEAGPIAQRYGIRSIPTVLIIKNGKEVGRYVGSRREEEYAAGLDKALE